MVTDDFGLGLITQDADSNDGGAEGDRTLDLRIANATLSQLSYRPMKREF